MMSQDLDATQNLAVDSTTTAPPDGVLVPRRLLWFGGGMMVFTALVLFLQVVLTVFRAES